MPDDVEKRAVLIVDTRQSWLTPLMLAAFASTHNGREPVVQGVDLAREPDLGVVELAEMVRKAHDATAARQPHLLPFPRLLLEQMVRRTRETRAFVRDLNRMRRGSKGHRRNVRRLKAAGIWPR